MAFQKAQRNNLYLRCALFGPSGSGKTMTALRIANGIAQKTGGRFAVIDTEARSASKYADRLSFDVDDLSDKTIDGYLKSMNDCIKAGYRVLVIDSLSHAWRELTEEVDRISQSGTSKNTFSAWGKVSPKQKRFIDAILNFPGHIIATMRSKTEWVISENKNGKLAPEKLGLAPEQGKGIEYEFDLLIEMNQNHQAVVTKDRTGKFQDAILDKPGEDFGSALYEWLSGMSEQKSDANPQQNVQKTGSEDDLHERGQNLINEIADILKSKNGAADIFSDEERTEMRNVIRATRLDAAGIMHLETIRKNLSDKKQNRLKHKAA